jgi:hypothetical protein
MTRKEALQKIGDDIISNARATLKKKGHIASGKLYNGMKAAVNGKTITFDIPKYGEYIDGGVRPAGKEGSERTKMPPINDIKAWCKRKGITDEGAAYAIQRSIFKNGSPSKNGERLPPSLFFTNAFEAYAENLDEVLDKYCGTLLEDI